MVIQLPSTYCPVLIVNKVCMSVSAVSGQRETGEARSLRQMGCSRCFTVRTRAAVKSM